METIATKRKRTETLPTLQLYRSDVLEDENDYLRPEGSRYCDFDNDISIKSDYGFLIPDAFDESEFTDALVCNEK